MSPPTRLLLIRHGQSVWNAEGRWQGQADPPLSALGERQALAAASRLGPVGAVYTSDLARARRTAEIVGGAIGLEPVVDVRLRERHAGEWQGRTRTEIDDRWPGYLESGRRPPGYEADESVLARARAALVAIAGESVPNGEGGDVVVVTHGGIVRTLERALADPGIPFAEGGLPNLGGRWLHHEGGTLRLGERVVLLDDEQATSPEQI